MLARLRPNGTTRTCWRAARPGDGSVRIDDLAARFGTLVLAGPRARDILAPLVDLDLANGVLPLAGGDRGGGRERTRCAAAAELPGRARLRAAPAGRAFGRGVRTPARGRGAGRASARSGSTRSRACGWTRPTGRGRATSTSASRPVRGRARALRRSRQARFRRPDGGAGGAGARPGGALRAAPARGAGRGRAAADGAGRPRRRACRLRDVGGWSYTLGCGVALAYVR